MANEKEPITMRTPFPDRLINKLPKGTKSQNDCPANEKINCKICGGWHHPKVVHLDYVGHAALTDRLLDVDPTWNWEPLAYHDGLPAFDSSGGLWIKLTVNGVTRLGYGHAAQSQYKDIGAREKEVIGDALRNAAMRFGAALDLWFKGDLHIEEQTDENAVKPAKHKPTDTGFIPDAEEETYLLSVVDSVKAKGEDYAEAAIYLEGEKLDNDEKIWVWSKLDSKVRAGIKKYNESIKEKKVD